MSALTRRDDHLNIIFQTFYGADTLRNIVLPSFTANLTVRDDGSSDTLLSAQATLRDCYIGEDSRTAIPELLREQYTNITFFQSSGESCLWKGESLADTSSCVIKVYKDGISPDSEVLNRLSHSKHPNIVTIREWGVIDPITFEVIEFVSDGTLSDMIARFPLSEAQCIDLLHNITDALEYLGSLKIIHADVKPENILRSEEGWKLCDFGISAISDVSGNAVRNGQTSIYAAPEIGSGILNSASDFWSLGMVVFHSLTHETDPINWNGYDRFHYAWQTLVEGLLCSDISNRWGIQQIRDWLNNLNETVVESTHRHDSLKELAKEVALRWYEMTSMVQNGSFSVWIEPRLREFGYSLELNPYHPNENADLYILRTLFQLDPDITPVWKEWAVSENNLSLMAQNALGDDPMYLQVIGEIYRLDVLHEVLIYNEEIELQQPREQWRDSVEEYYTSQEWMRRYDPSATFEDDKNISLLYLNRNDRISTVQWEPAYDVCYLWIGHLIKDGRKNRGVNLVAALAANRFRGTMLNHLDINFLEPLEGVENTEQFHLFKNAPVIAMRADPIPIQFHICNEEIAIGRRVRISWDVSGASWCYFSATGKVESQGWIELSIGESTRFTIYAVSWIGYSQSSIVVSLDERPILNETIDLEPVVGNVIDVPTMEVAQESLSPPILLSEERVLHQRDLPEPTMLNQEVLVLNEPLELNNQSPEERS
jgi:serine/threonine protein kinase